MKIITKVGNLLDVKAGHIVHGCNSLGVMGSGVALAIRNMYPGAYETYRATFDDEGLEMGWAYPYCPTTDLVIWNAITQEFCGSDGRRYVSYDAVANAFEEINETVNEFDLIPKEIHIPLIGAGLGGGNWEIIREIIEQTTTVPVTLWMLK
jgi:O-acetyl-ADP-ribose deacetylase (regulator of RNase III)